MPEDAIPMMKFGVGQPVPRMEDPKLLRGEGRYTDDVNLPGQVYAVMVRSPVAHGIIRAIDTSEAKGMPGVLGVYTGADLVAAGIGKFGAPALFQNKDGTPQKTTKRDVLAIDKVRFGGEAVAFAVATTRAQAKDAAEAVILDIEALPAVTDPVAASRPGAPLIHDSIPGNVSLEFSFGEDEKTEAAFANAAHVTRLHLINNRLVCNPMEPRTSVGVWEADSGRYVIHACSQGVALMKNGLKDVMQVPPEQIRVFTYNVGGSFGMKIGPYPENICCLFAAKALGRPVKWTDDRSESFMSDHHGRGQEIDAALALDKDGNFLAVKITGVTDCGAYNAGPAFSTVGSFRNLVGVYKTPIAACNLKLVITNTTPIGAYRGAGRPEANYFMERLVETAAREMGIDVHELRRRNMIAPNAFPHTTPHNVTYDSGDFAAIMAEAMAAADVKGFAARKAEAKARGKLRGMGTATFLEITAPAGNELGGLRFEADGSVTMITGTLDYGQGHASAFAQVVVDKLGIPFDKLKLFQSDSDEVTGGGPTGGSRSAMSSGTAMLAASDKVIENGTKIAAHVLEAAEQDIRFADGRFTIAGTDRSIGLLDLAERLHKGALKLPPEAPQSLDAKLTTGNVPSAYPNGCHIVEVEIDPDTGITDLVKYTTVNDFGTLVNPMLVEGQVHGGVMQGVGQALTERTVYNEDGQLVSGSFMDYCMPRADNACSFTFRSHPVPTKGNPLGIKGCGEAGCAGSIPSIMNAVVDALWDLGIRHIDMPATPDVVWKAIHGVAH